MIYDYVISVKLQADTWSGNVVTQKLYLKSNLPDLGVLLHTLDASKTVMSLTVHRMMTIPTLTKLCQMTREELNIQEKEMVKVI